jgi:hypothetical protein
MYTVCRFIIGSDTNEEKLLEVGAALNEIRPGQFERLDRSGGRFSVTISTSDSWQAHLVAIRQFIDDMSSVISTAVSERISVEIDVAIEPEDLGSQPYVSYMIPSRTLEELGVLGITLVLTQYT